MVYDVAHFISKACSCVKKKRPSKLDVAPFQCIITSAPMELICLDFLHLDQGGRDCRYLQVVTAHFSGFTQGHPTINKKGKTTAECLSNDFKLRYGMPSKVLHNQGGEFENDLFKTLRPPTPPPPLSPSPSMVSRSYLVPHFQSRACGRCSESGHIAEECLNATISSSATELTNIPLSPPETAGNT